MALFNEINKGVVTSMNGMTMYRKCNVKQPFQTVFDFIDDDNLSYESYIQVNYLEYYRNSNGDIVDVLTQYKNYIIPNIVGYTKTQEWFNTFARYPVVTTYGIMDAIEYTLNLLPQTVPNGYILENPNP